MKQTWDGEQAKTGANKDEFLVSRIQALLQIDNEVLEILTGLCASAVSGSSLLGFQGVLIAETQFV